MSSQALTIVQAPSAVEVVDWDERKRLFAQAVARQATPAQVDVVIAICRELGMNPLTNHINLIDGQAYITHKGLLHVAHRSGQLNGIVIESQGETETHYTATVSVYRKDMGHAFTYPGRYPKAGRNKAYGPEMALTRAETMALRRAFDVALGVIEELNETSDAARPQQGQQSTVRALPAPAPVSAELVEEADVIEEAPPGLGDADFLGVQRRLRQHFDDGLAESAIGVEMQRETVGCSEDQLRMLKRLFVRLKRERAAEAPSPFPDGIVGEADDFAAVVGAPQLPVSTNDPPAKTAWVESIKALCNMKHIEIGEALSQVGVAALSDLTQPQAKTVTDWLQTQGMCEAVTA